MDLHQSANLDKNLYDGGNPWHTDLDWEILRGEEEDVGKQLPVAHLLFRSCDISHYHPVAQLAFRAEVASVVVEVHSWLCVSSISVDSVVCHFGKEGSHLFDFHKQLPGGFPSQPSPYYAMEKHHPVSFLLGHQRKVC
jgi:hypothetical protein